MMTQPIFDMHAVAAQNPLEADTSEGLLDMLLDGLDSLPQNGTADDMLERAASYDETQPSFAADLRAAIA